MDLLSSYQVENKKYEIIPPKIHGVVDYFVVVFLLLSPRAFGLTGYVGAFTYALAGAYLLLALFTDYNAGLFKRIDFSLHGKIDFMMSEILIILAYTFFNHDPAVKMYYQALGSALLLIWLFTHYKNAPIPLMD